MKQPMTWMLGLSLAFGTVSVALAQDTPPKKSSKRKTRTGGKKKEETPRKDGGAQ